jgi:hypothetical protein
MMKGLGNYSVPFNKLTETGAFVVQSSLLLHVTLASQLREGLLDVVLFSSSETVPWFGIRQCQQRQW